MNPKSMILLLPILLGCATNQAAVPPVLEPSGARGTLVTNQRFSLVALDFGTENDARGRLTQTLPAMLLTELNRYGRFAVHEAGGIRRSEAEEAFSEKNASELADAYLSGTIISDTGGKACFELRLANSQNHEILYADAHCVDVSTHDGQVSVKRENVTALARQVSDSIPQISARGKVVEAEDGLLTIDFQLGPKQVMPRGMVGLLLATGDSPGDRAGEKMVREYARIPVNDFNGPEHSPVVGSVYVVSVQGNRCQAVIYQGEYGVPGDEILFK